MKPETLQELQKLYGKPTAMATEKRLIDLDIIKPIDFPSNEMDGLDVVRYLNTLPTVDAEEVVRCKDCRYLQSDARGLWCFNDYEHDLQPNDFCSYGERRTDGR